MALKRGLAGDTVQIDLVAAADGMHAADVLRAMPGTRDVVANGSAVRARVSNGPANLPAILAKLDEAGIAPTAVTVARPSVNDVYLRYAGRAFRDADSTSVGRDDVPRERVA